MAHNSVSLEQVRALELENAELRSELERLCAASPNRGLSKREALLVEAERVAHLGSWTWDLTTDEIEWSDELYRILGYDPACTRPSVEGFFAALHPDDRERVKQHTEEDLRASRTRPCEFRIVTSGGKQRSVRMEGAVLHDALGKQTMVVGSVLDLTESLNAAQLLSRTIEELGNAQRVARMGSYSWDLAVQSLSWSPGMYDLFGLDGHETPTEELFMRHVHPDDVAFVTSERNAALATALPRACEYRVVQRDGTVLNVVMDSQPQCDRDGALVAFRGVIQDITRRKLLDEQLRQSQKMEAVGTLAGGVAHDFNNYLMVLSGQAEMLRYTLGPLHPGRASLDAIKDACDRCAALTSQLLTLSRKRRVAPQQVDLNALLERMAPMVRSVLGEASELELKRDAPSAYVHADPAQLEQAIMNLSVNARDAMPGGGRLTLSVEHVVVDGSAPRAPDAGPSAASIRLSVSDTGVGIAPEHCERIFEPFFTTKDVGRGTGLGLTTTYGIINQAGGSIDVDSEPGRGTTFRIHLPPSTEPAKTVAARAQERSAPADGRRVLLVEDVAAVRTVLRDQLERAGYRVISVAHGRAALDLLASAPDHIDLVLSDVVMPVMGGVELERQLAKLRPRVPCILMTGYSAAALGGRSSGRGVLHKPFSSKELLAAVRDQLQQPPSEPREPRVTHGQLHS